MQIKNNKFAPPYWDDGNVKKFKWFTKRQWKRIFRKKWQRDRLKDNNNE